MPTLNREYPEGNLVPETNPYIRQKLLPVNLPLTKEQIELIKFLDWYLEWSQDPQLNQGKCKVPAVGIAANQIGFQWQMFAYKINLKNKKSILTIINPIITAASKKICYFAHGEGCLTQKADKNFQGIVPRHYKITFQGVTWPELTKINKTIRGTEAVVFQHEYDHLRGKLCHDRIVTKNPWKVESSWIKIDNKPHQKKTEAQNH